MNHRGRGKLYDVIHALADNMCQSNVFNFSFAYEVLKEQYHDKPEDMFTDLMKYAGEKHNCLFVVGSGNNGRHFQQNSTNTFILPAEAELDNMIAVYSIDNNSGDLTTEFNRAPGSNFGEQKKTLRIGAPGERVLSTSLNGKWSYMWGTSMATASITAAAAIVSTYQTNTFDYHKVRDIIDQTRQQVGKVQLTGEATEALNICRAIEMARSQGYNFSERQEALARIGAKDITASPNPSNGTLHVSFTSVETGEATIQLLDLRGQQLFTKHISAQKGQNTDTLELQQLPSGIYQLVVRSGKEAKMVKVFKN